MMNPAIPFSIGQILNGTGQLETDICVFDLMAREDCQLILDLRQGHSSSFLRQIDTSLEAQEAWFEKYSERNRAGEEGYFRIYSKAKQSYDAILRITQVKDDGLFNWESFVVREGSDPRLPIDAMLAVYALGFEIMDKDQCGPWDVDKDHKSMQKIHSIIGMAKVVSQSQGYFQYTVRRQDFEQNISRFRKIGYGNLIHV